MPTLLSGVPCQAFIRARAGDDSTFVMDLNAVCTLVRHNDMISVSNFSGPPTSIYGVHSLEVRLESSGAPIRATTVEQMALAVLRNDQAAAAMLADHVINDLQWKAEGGLTRDDLLSRIDDLQRQLRDANDRIETLGHPAPVFPEVDPWAGTY